MAAEQAASGSVSVMPPTEVCATSLVQAEFWSRRERPPAEEVRPGIWAIPVPVRGPIRFVYAYLILGDGETLLIDPGERGDAALEALRAGFALAGVELTQLTGIVVTHFHYDHWEGADQLAEVTGAWVAISEIEWNWISQLTVDATSMPGMLPWFEGFGATGEEARQLADAADYGDTLVYRRPELLLQDGDVLPIAGTNLEVILTPGHSPGHVCVFDRDREVLFSGDHVLPNITPHIALNRFGGPDPLGQYLSSLERLRDFGDVEVLPAHEYRFSGLQLRLDALRDDVEQRADEVRAVIDRDRQATPWSAAPHLRWSRPWEGFTAHVRRMAVDETAAHFARLRALEAPRSSR